MKTFAIGSVLLALAAGVILGVAKSSLVLGVASFVLGLILQLAGKELARRAIAKTGTKAPEDYASAFFLGWLISVVVGALITWGILELF